jgi:VanZ family protein
MKIAQDKQKHFYVGIGIGIATELFFSYLLPAHAVIAALLAAAVSFAGAYSFELYSKFTGRGHYELMDAIAALIGAIPGILVVLLFRLL